MIDCARLPVALTLIAVCGPAWSDPPSPKPRADVLLPPGAVRQFGEVRLRHAGGIRAAALSPDGKWLATVASQSVILWDTASGRPIRRLDAALERRPDLQSVTFSPDGALLAATGAFSDLFVWDAGTGKEVHRVLGARGGRDSSVGFVAFTPDGRQLLLSTGSKTEILDARTWKAVHSVADLGRRYSAVGPTLVSQNAKGGVYLCDPLAERPSVPLDVDTHAGGLALSPDGRALATFSVYGRLQLWSIPEGRQLKSEDVWGDVRSGLIAFAADGKRLFLVTPDGITERDAATLQVLGQLPHPPEARATAIHLLPDGDTLLVCANDGIIWRYSRKTGKPQSGLLGYTTGVRAAATRDGRWLAVGDQSGRVDIWDTTTVKPADTISESGGPVHRLAFSQDGTMLALGRGPALELRDVRTRQIVGPDAKKVVEIRPGGGPLPTVQLIEFGPDRRLLVGTTRGNQLKCWDLMTGNAQSIDTRNGVGTFTWDGKAVVCPGPNQGLVFLDPKTGVTLRRANWPREFRDHLADRITVISFSPDGRRLVVATDDGRFHVCDPASGDELAVFPPPDPAKSASRRTAYSSAGARTLAFSPDGCWLAAGGWDGAVRLWELATRREVCRLRGHERGTSFVGFGPGGKSVLSAGDDGTVYQWDPRPPAAPPARSTWDDLGADDPVVAYRAVWALTDDKDAVRMLRAKLPAAAGPTPEELARLIERLNADQFAAREAAMRTLADLGPQAMPALRKAAAGKLSSEARERINKLLARKSDEPTPAEFRA
ncbi:MAG TPA: hypothetical protein VKD90_12805, partial [Gemmataceae bacterium]|nr:hypothetical protein [Gemmataceae bacterium]